MLSYYDRNIDYLELKIQCAPLKLNARFTLAGHVLPHLKKACKEKIAVYKTKNNTAALHVHQVDVDEANNVATILFHYTDTNITDPAFKDMKSGEVRVEGKSTNEGIAVSAHLVINIDTINNSRDSIHLALLEMVPGLSKTLIERALTALFNGIIERPKWIVKDKEKNKSIKCRPSFSLKNIASESLTDGLKSRRLNLITLVTTAPSSDDFDEDDLTLKESQISFAVGKDLTDEAKEKLIYNLSQKAKNKGYNVLKVNYDDEYQGNKTGTFKSLDKEVIKHAIGVFTKRSKINTSTMIVQCQKTLHSDLVFKCKELLCKEGNKEYVDRNVQETPETTVLSPNQA